MVERMAPMVPAFLELTVSTREKTSLPHLLGQDPGPRTLVLFGSLAHPSTNCYGQRGGVM